MPDDPYLIPKPIPDVVKTIARQNGIPDDVADDYLKVAKVESGQNTAVRSSKKGALGFGQVMPDVKGGTTRTVGGQKYDLRDPLQNIEAGLKYFHEGGDDPVGRRLYYFGGPKAKNRYEKTGRIPNISDGNLTASQYVKATGASATGASATGVGQDDQDDPYLVPKAVPQQALVDDPYLVPKTPRELKPKVTSSVVEPTDEEYRQEFNQLPEKQQFTPPNYPTPKPIQFRPRGMTELAPGTTPSDLLAEALTEDQKGGFKEELQREKLKPIPSLEVGSHVKVPFSPNANPNPDQVVDAYLGTLGPEYVAAGQKYKQQTGNNILKVGQGQLRRDKDGSFYIAPTRGAIDFLNKYVQSGGDEQVANAEAQRIYNEQKQIVGEAKQAAAPTIAEIEAGRREAGSRSAASRTLTAPAEKFVGGILDELGGAANLGGITHTQLGDYLKQRGKVLSTESSLNPLTDRGEEIDRPTMEKLGIAAQDLGYTVAQLAMLKHTTGLKLGTIMALESALKDSDKPPVERAANAAKAYAMGNALEVPMGRVMSGAVFGVPTGVEGTQQALKGERKPLDVAIDTAVQGLGGAILGGHKAEPLTELGIESQPTFGVPGRGALDADRILAERERINEPAMPGLLSEVNSGELRTIDQPKLIKKFRHIDFGDVEVAADQSGAKKGRVKVVEVDDPSKVHYVKKVTLGGRGNERMVPLLPPRSAEPPPRSEQPEITPSQAQALPAPAAPPEPTSPGAGVQTASPPERMSSVEPTTEVTGVQGGQPADVVREPPTQSQPRNQIRAELDKLRQILVGNGGRAYVRWSKYPLKDIKRGYSMNWAGGLGGQRESGLSAKTLTSDMSDADLLDAINEYSHFAGSPYLFSGERAGWDADGAPTIQGARLIGDVKRLHQLYSKAPQTRMAAKVRDALRKHNVTEGADSFGMRIDPEGLSVWTRTYGGAKREAVRSVMAKFGLPETGDGQWRYEPPSPLQPVATGSVGMGRGARLRKASEISEPSPQVTSPQGEKTNVQSPVLSDTASLDATVSGTTTEKDAAAKRPWQMTRTEFVNQRATQEAKAAADLDKVMADWRASKKTSHQGENTKYARRDSDMRAFRQSFSEEKARQIEQDHKNLVVKALREGKPVPAEVLKDYPDLAKKYSNAAQTSPADRASSPLTAQESERPQNPTKTKGDTNATIETPPAVEKSAGAGQPAAPTSFDSKSEPAAVRAARERKAKRLAEKAEGVKYMRAGADPYELLDDIIIRDEFGSDADEHLNDVWAQIAGAGQKERSLPKTLASAGMEPGDNLTYTPETLERGETEGRRVLREKGLDGAIEHVLHGEAGIEWAPTGFAALDEMRAAEAKASDPEEAKAISEKRRKFAGDFAERATELGQMIVGIRAIEQFAPDRAAYIAAKLSKKGRGKILSAEEESRITQMAERLSKVSQRNEQLEQMLAEQKAAAIKRQKKPKDKKTDYQSRLDEQAQMVRQILKPKVGRLDFGSLATPSKQRGRLKVGIPPLPGDAELLAQYAASRLNKVDTVTDLNNELVKEFGKEVEPYLPEIRQRAYAIRAEAREAELREAPKERRRTILQEIQAEISQKQKEHNEAVKNARLDQKIQAVSELSIAKKGQGEGYDQIAREARQRLKELREEAKRAGKAEVQGWRAEQRRRREAARKVGLWDTPIRNEASQARERLRNATDPNDPDTWDNLISVAAERFLPDKEGGVPRKGVINPAQFYAELKDEFPDLVTKKTQQKIYKEGYQRVQDAIEASREVARQRSASKESQRLWDELGIDEDVQSILIQRSRTAREAQEWRSRMAREFERVSRSPVKKAVDELSAFPRALQSSIDAPLGRQGIFFAITHPVETLRTAVPATIQGYKAIRRGDYQRLLREMESHPDYDLAQRAGVDLPVLASETDPRIHAEEQFQSGWAEKLPHVRLSEQAFTLGMNSQRLAMFKRYADLGRAEGYTWENNPDYYKQIASFVNDATGRGTMSNKIKQFTALGNHLLYSTRLNVSRLQLLNDLVNPRKYLRYDPVMRKIAIREALKTAAVMATMYTVAKQLGWGVTMNPDDPDFGKIRVGKIHYDPTGGEAGTIRFLFRFLRGMERLVTGKPVAYSDDPYRVAKNFGRQKLAPIPGAVIDWTVGSDVVGKPVMARPPKNLGEADQNMLIKLVTPMIVQDFMNGYVEEGWSGVAKTVPGLSGVSIQAYMATAEVQEVRRRADELNQLKKKAKASGQTWSADDEARRHSLSSLTAKLNKMSAQAKAAKTTAERDKILLEMKALSREALAGRVPAARATPSARLGPRLVTGPRMLKRISLSK